MVGLMAKGGVKSNFTNIHKDYFCILHFFREAPNLFYILSEDFWRCSPVMTIILKM